MSTRLDIRDHKNIKFTYEVVCIRGWILSLIRYYKIIYEFGAVYSCYPNYVFGPLVRGCSELIKAIIPKYSNRNNDLDIVEEFDLFFQYFS